MARLTFHGHATFSIKTDVGTDLVIDPFFSDNPSFTGSVDDIGADFILLTHGHHDHVADVVPLAERKPTKVNASIEITRYPTTGIDNMLLIRTPEGVVPVTGAYYGGE